MSKVLDKARELGEALLQCPELKALKDAESVLAEDAIAQAVLQEFAVFQQKMEEIQKTGMGLSPEQQARIEEIETRMQENAVISSFVDAQVQFEKVLEGINGIISQAIGGGDECEPEDCHSCGCGCH